MNEKVDVLAEYFPVVVRLAVGGLLALISTLGGYIWRRQQKQIHDLEETVKTLQRDAALLVSREQLDDMRESMDRKFDKIERQLVDHNATMSDKLDKLMWHMIHNRDPRL